jgi:asparagine synthase (glutamine-hydrolysing)
MCGIVGIVAFNKSSKNELDLIENAVKTLNKRGPDSHGKYAHKNIALGHTRLSIIDTSDKGAQPFTDQTDRYTIVFNGEFYNYQKQRRILEARGLKFRSASDTEVVLQMFIQYGVRCLEEINGFFALAIYDKVDEALFIARDRMGIKPFVYYLDENKFIFASEIKALLEFDIKREIDTTSLFTYLQLNYIPAPYSILQGIRKVKPGHYFHFKLNDASDKIEEKKYYEIPEIPDNITEVNSGSYKEAQVKLQQLVENAITKRMVSDVPLGTFLSGGIDSSIITSVAAKYTNNLQSFSIGYKDEPYFDETEFANLVAKKCGSNHTVFSLSNDDLFENYHEVLEYLDEPFADSSAIPVYILSKLTRKEVTVALSGDGADEIFSGYNKHQAELKARQPGIVGKSVTLLNPLLKKLPQSRSSKIGNFNRQMVRFGDGVNLTNKDRYWRWATFLNEEQSNYFLKESQRINIQRLSDEAYNYKKRKDNLLCGIKKGGSFNDVLRTDMELVLQNDMLRKVDSMSMANSLEIRTPFLDHKLVDFAFSLPSVYKINGSMRKKILKDTFKNLLPHELHNRPKKGFEVPLLNWFQTELKTKISEEWLSDEFIEEQGIFNLTAIKELKQKLFSTNPGDAHATVWAIIAFQHWWKKYMTQSE